MVEKKDTEKKMSTSQNEIKEGAIPTPDTEGYCCLGKISDSGRKLELSGSRYDYPTEVNPDSLKYDYTILYRQEQLATPRISFASGWCILLYLLPVYATMVAHRVRYP